MKLVGQFEGKIPWKYAPDFLEYIGITEKEFLDNLDRFTNKKIFKCDGDGKLIKDKDGNPVKRYPTK